MRLAVVFAILTLFATGCTTTTTPAGSPTSAGDWRVVPLNPMEGSNHPPAILVDQRTGETWIYSSSSGQWSPIKRNQ